MAKAELSMLTHPGSRCAGYVHRTGSDRGQPCGLKVLGISCITDMAVPDALESISHAEVMAMAEQTKPLLSNW
jgi:purine-nucleoside phosphorylase